MSNLVNLTRSDDLIRLNDLPDELLFNILSFLNIHDLKLFALTSQRNYSFAKDPILLRQSYFNIDHKIIKKDIETKNLTNLKVQCYSQTNLRKQLIYELINDCSVSLLTFTKLTKEELLTYFLRVLLKNDHSLLKFWLSEASKAFTVPKNFVQKIKENSFSYLLYDTVYSLVSERELFELLLEFGFEFEVPKHHIDNLIRRCNIEKLNLINNFCSGLIYSSL
jgi:F-box domain.